MIGVSKLMVDTKNYGDSLRYSSDVQGAKCGTTLNRGPVVVWNCTKTCNLKCIHCYAGSDAQKYENELTTTEAVKFIDDLHRFRVPVILFSGGEPLLREDILYLAQYATNKGIRTTFSTNGTLINQHTAQKLKEIGVGYVGISLDGLGENNDKFRGKKGAFDLALRGIRNCLAVEQKVGLRFTINRHNHRELESIFNLIEEERIPRVCFYHLAYSGRGNSMVNQDITHGETRAALDLIYEKVKYFKNKKIEKEILTVDNHADGIYIYLKLLKENNPMAQHAFNLLKINGGNRTGIAIGAVDWFGNVHPDQFTQNYTFGNVRERSFGDIWTDTSHPILSGLKDRKKLLKGRCVQCKWLDMCNGNFRSRAEAVSGDFWQEDPACYLTDEEIGITEKVVCNG
ncbi:MAG: Fe-S oxidoreductase [Clostridiaceae bacterium BRH_c20a]|nr:MAG: Fe-S oxidoreductase [Clostridiaceae bacterium BRH_c20a]